jgi:hypothetical protein
MSNKTSKPGDGRTGQTIRADLEKILGKIDEDKVLAILALRPSVAEIEEAKMWANGYGDTIGKEGYRLEGVVAEIFEILTAEEDEPERVSR